MNIVRMDRLCRFFNAYTYDPWGVGFRLKKHMSETSAENKEVFDLAPGFGYSWYAIDHAARIRYISRSARMLSESIWIDNECTGKDILPIPVIIDGNHRFLAHAWLKLEWVPVEYGGRIDLLEYLTGESDSIPY